LLHPTNDGKRGCELRAEAVRDFACGLRRPQNGFRRSLTLFSGFRLRAQTPAKRLPEIPHFVSGFRLRAQTPAKRLNLLKRFAASTLEIFHSEHIPRGFARFVGDREGGEDEWVGPVSRLRSLVFF
jgi:hypothetical protein